MHRRPDQKLVKIAVAVPSTHAKAVRKAAGGAGAGRLGNYSHASFSVKGTGRFLPKEGANPTIGIVGQMEEVGEERIEWTCTWENASTVIAAIRSAHPYEEPVIDVYPLETI